jgi:ABC-2 type transport system permease protein
MDNLWHVFRFEFSRMLQRRAYLFMTFVVPVLAVVIMFGVLAYQDFQASRPEDPQQAASEEDEEINQLGYVDESGMFPEPGLFATALTRYDDVDSALAAMDANEVDSVFVIGADYEESGTITRYINEFSLDSITSDGFFRSFLLNNLLRGVDRDLILRLQSDVVFTEHNVAETGESEVAQSEDASFLIVYVFGLLLAFATFFAGGYLLQSVVEEKETRMVEVILSAMRPLPLLTGKVLAYGILGLFQVVLWAVTAVFIMDRLGNIIPALAGLTVSPELVFWSVVYFVLGYLLFSGGYAAIGAISTSQREGPQMAVFITLPAMLPFYFLTLFIESPHATLPVVLSLFPITAPMSMIMRLGIADVPLIEILISLVLLAIATVGLIWFAGRLFRVNTLLAGQSPKLRDLVRIVRED